MSDLLLKLNVSKASGQDGISAMMLKHTASSIAPSLTKIFNLSVLIGTFSCFPKFLRLVGIKFSEVVLLSLPQLCNSSVSSELVLPQIP